MTRFLTKPVVVTTATIEVTEVEMRALDALAGYGDDAFMKVFYEHLGEHYMKPHDAGMRSFLKSVRSEIPCVLQRINKARHAFKEHP